MVAGSAEVVVGRERGLPTIGYAGSNVAMAARMVGGGVQADGSGERGHGLWGGCHQEREGERERERERERRGLPSIGSGRSDVAMAARMVGGGARADGSGEVRSHALGRLPLGEGGCGRRRRCAVWSPASVHALL